MLLCRTLTIAVLALIPFVGCKRSQPGFGAGLPEIAPTKADEAPQAEPPRAEPPGAGERLSVESGFAPVVDRVAGAVVNVSSTRVLHPEAGEQNPFFEDPLFRQFFGHGPSRPPKEMREQALGSGVIVSRDGYVLTNAHVVHGANEVRVMLPDKREFRAKIVGQDPKTDIALIRIPAGDYPVVTFGDSTRVRVGDFALAIGDPLGLGQTVTMGIISAKGRGNVGIVDYEDFLQTDAAINPGNSGGALVNVDGQIIGIPTAIATIGGARGNQGIGFAVPSNLAREVMTQIEQHGRVIRGWLGVAVQDVTSAMAGAMGLPGPGGALVGDVTQGSPAEKAGLKRGDVIVKIDGKPVSDSRSLRMQIAETSPGSSARLTVVRNGATVDVPVTLGEMPNEQQQGPAGAEKGGAGAMGIQVTPLTPDLAQRLDLPEGTAGVVVTQVQPGSRAADAGLRSGDVIQEIDKKKVSFARRREEGAPERQAGAPAPRVPGRDHALRRRPARGRAVAALHG